MGNVTKNNREMRTPRVMDFAGKNFSNREFKKTPEFSYRNVEKGIYTSGVYVALHNQVD